MASRRAVARVAVLALGLAVLGAVAGLLLGLQTPAHVEIAGSDTRVWIEPGRTYDQVGVSALIGARRAADRTVLGEPIGVRAVIDLNTGGLLTERGTFDVDVLPAYVQAFSDPNQVVVDVRRALIGHLVLYLVGGAVVGLLAGAATWGTRSRRAAFDRVHLRDDAVRTAVGSYRRAERTFARRVAAGLVILVAVAALPAARPGAPVRTVLRADPALGGTVLAGLEIDGLLRPAVLAVQNYIETYFEQTDTYYRKLLATLGEWLPAAGVALPGAGDAGIAQIGFVADRHCNIGMDRVAVALMKSYGVHTLVSGGDDAFSGTFPFESACTRNLADKTAQAGITDVFVGGNHDSPATITDEAKQRIRTLTGSPVTADGLTFLGSPDPRTSRYGQGIVPPSSAAQHALVVAQGAAIGTTACGLRGPVIAVLHDPSAGEAALADGCGKVTTALDGHTHTQQGPDPFPAGASAVGYRFTSASTGGAPGGASVDTSLGSKVTVGPLNHDATVNIVSIERSTGRLVGVTEFRFTPDQQISSTQQTTAG